MDRKLVRQKVVDSLEETLAEQLEHTITDQTDPIRGLGLNSDDGLDFACTLSEKLGFEIDVHINPFVDDERKSSRNIRQIVALVCEMLPAEVGNA